MRYANVFKITKEIQGSRRTKEINLNTKLFVYVANAKRHNATRLRQHEYLIINLNFFTINYNRTCPVHPERRATLRSAMPIDNAS